MEESKIVLSKIEELGDAEIMIENMRGVIKLWMESVNERLSMEEEVEIKEEEEEKAEEEEKVEGEEEEEKKYGRNQRYKKTKIENYNV